MSLEDVGPSFEDIIDHAKDEEGIIDLSKISDLEGRYSHIHGNKRCDVLYGFCACGAYHDVSESDKEVIDSIFKPNH